MWEVTEQDLESIAIGAGILGTGGGGNGASNDASDPHSGVAHGGSYFYPVSGVDTKGGGGISVAPIIVLGIGKLSE